MGSLPGRGGEVVRMMGVEDGEVVRMVGVEEEGEGGWGGGVGEVGDDADGGGVWSGLATAVWPRSGCAADRAVAAGHTRASCGTNGTAEGRKALRAAGGDEVASLGGDGAEWASWEGRDSAGHTL